MEEIRSPISYKRARNFSFSYHNNTLASSGEMDEETHVRTTQGPVRTKRKQSCSLLAAQQEEQKMFLPRLHPKNICSQEPKKTVRVKNKKKKLYSRRKYFESLAEETSNPDKEYEGMYKTGHTYMTEYDRHKADDRERRKKRLGGMFQRYSGVASAIPLRKEGVVRTQGTYFNRPEEAMYNREKPNLLEGPWKPGASQLIFSPIKKTQKLKPI